MKYNITVEGGHQAEVNIEMDAKGGFSGTVVSADYGTGEIANGKANGPALSGNVSLDGYDADFSATVMPRH